MGDPTLARLRHIADPNDPRYTYCCKPFVVTSEQVVDCDTCKMARLAPERAKVWNLPRDQRQEAFREVDRRDDVAPNQLGPTTGLSPCVSYADLAMAMDNDGEETT